jgi:hypothetical protein
MSIISPAIKSILKLRQSAIQNFVLNPIDTQTQVFNDLIGSGQYTIFGKAHDFENINSLKDFKNQIPINDYDSLKPYIDRIIHGEQNVLWNEPIGWFAKSSGTTSDKSKFIPISPSCLKETHYKSGQDVLSINSIRQVFSYRRQSSNKSIICRFFIWGFISGINAKYAIYWPNNACSRIIDCIDG